MTYDIRDIVSIAILEISMIVGIVGSFVIQWINPSLEYKLSAFRRLVILLMVLGIFSFGWCILVS